VKDDEDPRFEIFFVGPSEENVRACASPLRTESQSLSSASVDVVAVDSEVLDRGAARACIGRSLATL
jgi:hypothetical protein